MRLKFDPQSGRERSEKRSALVLSPEIYNKKTGLVLFCPMSRQIKGYHFEVNLPAKLPISGVILVDRIKNRDWRTRYAIFNAKLPDQIMQDVFSRLSLLLEE